MDGGIMPIGIRRIGRPLSHVQKGLLKKPIRRANEGPLAWYKRLKRWMDTTERHEKWKERQRSKLKKPSKKVKPRKVKRARPKSVRQKLVEEKKKTEKLLGIKRGIKKKPKKNSKKKKKK